MWTLPSMWSCRLEAGDHAVGFTSCLCHMMSCLKKFTCSTGCSCCYEKIIDPTGRCERHNERDSWKVWGAFEGRWSVHGADIMSLFLFPHHTQIEPIFVLTLSWQVTANMRGSSTEEVAARVLSQPSLSGLQVRFETETMFLLSSLLLLFLYLVFRQNNHNMFY